MMTSCGVGVETTLPPPFPSIKSQGAIRVGPRLHYSTDFGLCYSLAAGADFKSSICGEFLVQKTTEPGGTSGKLREVKKLAVKKRCLARLGPDGPEGCRVKNKKAAQAKLGQRLGKRKLQTSLKRVKVRPNGAFRHLHLLAVATFLFLPCADQDANVLCMCYPSCPYPLKKVNLSIALQQKFLNQTSRQTANHPKPMNFSNPALLSRFCF